jgi:hypothetical protein
MRLITLQFSFYKCSQRYNAKIFPPAEFGITRRNTRAKLERDIFGQIIACYAHALRSLFFRHPSKFPSVKARRIAYTHQLPIPPVLLTRLLFAKLKTRDFTFAFDDEK